MKANFLLRKNEPQLVIPFSYAPLIFEIAFFAGLIIYHQGKNNK